MSAVHYWMLKERAETSLLEKITMLMHGGKQIFRFWPKLMCYTPTPTPRHGNVITVISPIAPLSTFINCILCFKLLIICVADMEISWQLPNAFYFEIMFRYLWWKIYQLKIRNNLQTDRTRQENMKNYCILLAYRKYVFMFCFCPEAIRMGFNKTKFGKTQE